MNICRPEMKTVLSAAFAAVAMGWSIHAGATDFSLQNNSVIAVVSQRFSFLSV
jgi:hypothetical protein